LKRLERVQRDSTKLADGFRKLGSHLKNAVSSYDNSEKRLSLFGNRVEQLLGSSKSKKQLPEAKDNE